MVPVDDDHRWEMIELATFIDMAASKVSCAPVTAFST